MAAGFAEGTATGRVAGTQPILRQAVPLRHQLFGDSPGTVHGKTRLPGNFVV